ECHDLLADWAVVLRHLIRRIGDSLVIGFTATLPDPENDEEYENYTSLLGDVDFEVPTPAVVKEGDLAPYRDLVSFVRPTAREQVYLAEIQSEFDAAVSRLAERPAFREWVTSLLLTAVPESSSQGSDATDAPPGPPVTRPPWEELLRTQPSLALAGMRFLIRLHHPTIPPLLWPAEAYQEPDWQDWIVLLERHGLDRLKPSADPEDHRELARL